MPANDVYMILYAIKAEYINKRIGGMKKQAKADPASIQKLESKYGDVK